MRLVLCLALLLVFAAPARADEAQLAALKAVLQQTLDQLEEAKALQQYKLSLIHAPAPAQGQTQPQAAPKPASHCMMTGNIPC